MKVKTLFASALLSTIAALFPLAGVASAAEHPIIVLEVKPDGFRTKSVWNEPVLIWSAEEAIHHFDKKSLAALQDAVDWKKQFVVVFAWQGSGQDKLEHQVLEGSPVQIRFSRKPGMTFDLGKHTYVFILRDGVKWTLET